MGIEFGTEKFLLWGEARHIYAKVEMEDFESLEWIPELDAHVSGTTMDLGKIRVSISRVFYQVTL